MGGGGQGAGAGAHLPPSLPSPAARPPRSESLLPARLQECGAVAPPRRRLRQIWESLARPGQAGGRRRRFFASAAAATLQARTRAAPRALAKASAAATGPAQRTRAALFPHAGRRLRIPVAPPHPPLPPFSGILHLQAPALLGPSSSRRSSSLEPSVRTSSAAPTETSPPLSQLRSAGIPAAAASLGERRSPLASGPAVNSGAPPSPPPRCFLPPPACPSNPTWGRLPGGAGKEKGPPSPAFTSEGPSQSGVPIRDFCKSSPSLPGRARLAAPGTASV